MKINIKVERKKLNKRHKKVNRKQINKEHEGNREKEKTQVYGK